MDKRTEAHAGSYMLVLLTGGSGMVGAHVATSLIQGGHKVRCLLRRPDKLGNLAGADVEIVQGDITDEASLQAAATGVEAVVHCAGVVSYWAKKAPIQWEVNVEGTRRLLEAAVGAGASRFVLTSSIAAVGYVTHEGLGDEDTPYNWGPYNIAYCETKRASEALVLEDTRIQGIAVNPGIAIGPQDLHFNGGRILSQAHHGQVFAIPPGSTTLCCVQDAARGHVLALERGRPGRRYILGGHTMPFAELFRLAGEVVGRPVPQRIIPPGLLNMIAHVQTAWGNLRDKEPQLTPQLAALSSKNRQYSCERAIGELGYEVSDLTGAMEAAYRWYVDHRMI